MKALESQLQQAREAYETAQQIEDVNERRRQAAAPLRDVRYFAARVRTAQVIAQPTSTSYTDSPGSGTFYYYVVAVGPSGQQSAPSNIVSATFK